MSVQVYHAPHILEILERHVQKRTCSKDDLLHVAAFVSRVSYTPKLGSTVPSNPHVRAIIAAATRSTSPLPEQAIFKLNTLFAATGTGAADYQKELLSSAAAAAVGRWPGGRHNNDYVHFRNIQVLPTVAELKHTSPFLPLTDCSDQFLVWEVRSCGCMM